MQDRGPRGPESPTPDPKNGSVTVDGLREDRLNTPVSVSSVRAHGVKGVEEYQPNLGDPTVLCESRQELGGESCSPRGNFRATV